MLKIGSFIRMVNFDVVSKCEKSFENSDLHIVLKVQSTTSLRTTPNGGKNDFISKFIQSDSIVEFRKRLYEQWETTTIVICVFSIKGQFEHYYQMIIGEGYTKNGNDILALTSQFWNNSTKLLKVSIMFIVS